MKTYGMTNKYAQRSVPTEYAAKKEYIGESSRYWLQDRGTDGSDYAAYVNIGGGKDPYGEVVNADWVHVRPALNLNMDYVLFITKAQKGDLSYETGNDSLTEVPDYFGSEWRLTLLDKTRNFDVSTKSVSMLNRGGDVNFNYSNAAVGDGEYLTAMIVDSYNNVLYYGQLNQLETGEESGTQTVTIPALSEGTYTLKVFNEHITNLSSDYASAFCDVELIVAAPTYKITISEDPLYGGTATGGGIYIENTSATVKAIANDGYYFASWRENGMVVSTDTTYEFTVTQERNLVAVFSPEAIYSHIHTPADTWTTDDTHHWKVCTVDGCGATVKGTKAEHSSTGDNVATCQSRAKCDVCGVEYGTVAAHDPESNWSSDASGHWHMCKTSGCSEKVDFATHVFDQKVATSKYKATDATYTKKATYYKSCVCGAAGTETFESGNVLPSAPSYVPSGSDEDTKKTSTPETKTSEPVVTKEKDGTEKTVTTEVVKDEKTGNNTTVTTEVVKDKEGEVINKSVRLAVEPSDEELLNKLAKTKQDKNCVLEILLPDIGSFGENASLSKVTLPKSVLKAAAKQGTDVIIEVKNEDGEVAYSWEFSGDALKETKALTRINLQLKVEAAKRLSENKGKNETQDTETIANQNLQQLLQDNVPKSKAIIVSFGHSGKLPGTVKIKLSVASIEGVKPGDVLQLYYYNEKAGKLEQLADSKYIVNDDLSITIAIDHCSEYVLLPETPPKNILYNPTIQFVKYTKKMKVGRKYTFTIALQDCEISSVNWSTTKINGATVAKNKGKLTVKVNAKSAKTDNIKVTVRDLNGKLITKTRIIKIFEK